MSTVQKYRVKWGGTVFARSLVVLVLSASLAQMPVNATNPVKADSLLAIDQNRSAVIDRVVRAWSAELGDEQGEALRTKLGKLRADQLLAASLSGSLEAVLDVMISAEQSIGKAPGREHAKALGEADRDVVYTPVSTCRLVETRTVYPNFGIPYYGAGEFSAGETRTYSLTSTCGLPAGVTALQAQVQGQATAGFGANVEATRAGGPFGGGLTLIAANSPLFTVVSSPIPVNLSNNSIGVQVTVATAHLVIDVVGYFMPANRNGDGLRVFGAGTSTPSVVNGDDSNTVGSATAATISGGTGNSATGNNSTVAGGVINQALANNSAVGGGTQNKVAANESVIGGGLANDIASGAYQAVIAGGFTNAILGTGNTAAISGGFRNIVGGYSSFIGAGANNTVPGLRSSIVGGFGGKNAGDHSFIGSGGSGTGSNCYNHVLNTNTAQCWNEIISGGGNSVVGGGQNNVTSGSWTFIGGGEGNRILVSDAAIVGGFGNTISANAYNAFIGAGNRNTASAGSATVAGGNSNTASGGSSFVGGGWGNKATANSSVVAGGGAGTASGCFNYLNGLSDQPCWNEASGVTAFVGAGSDNFASGDASVIVGGAMNRVSTPKSSIVGGIANTINADSTQLDNFIGGGRGNTISGLTASQAVIAGGRLNTVSGFAAFIGAGRGNTASGSRASVVGGGSDSLTCLNKTTLVNDFSCANVASGDFSSVGGGLANRAAALRATISGGENNDASSVRTTVGGGANNTASADGATVPGGRANWASGPWSLAAGRGAQTNTGGATPTHHFGTFLWSDAPDDGSGATPAATQVFNSSANNQFAVRARGGVVFKVDNVTVPANAGDATAGCSLPAGGSASWSCSSDRNLKEAIRAVSPKQILAKVAALPLSTWQFKGTERRHLSPMAQDFWAAFGFGEDDRHITASDVGGVALAAVQGLNLKLDAERADNRKKSSEITLLKAELAKIRRKLGM